MSARQVDRVEMEVKRLLKLVACCHCGTCTALANGLTRILASVRRSERR